MKLWLTTGEAAKLLGVTRRTVLRWLGRGYLESIRHPGDHGRFAIPREAIDKFYAERNGTSGTPSDSRVTPRA